MVQIYNKNPRNKQIHQESVKNKIGRNSLSYTLLLYGWLSLFTGTYFTSSKSASCTLSLLFVLWLLFA